MIFENITGVYQVTEQKTLSYKGNLEKFHPDFVVHGDDWVRYLIKSVLRIACDDIPFAKSGYAVHPYFPVIPFQQVKWLCSVR